MDEREELQALRRLAELEAKASGATAAAANPADVPFFENVAAGGGSALQDAWLAIQQMAGKVGIGDSKIADVEVADKRARDAPLDDTWGGKLGKVLAGVTTAVIPGANTMKGAALIGAGLGALQPTLEDESRVGNAALGGAFGAGGKVAGDKVGNALMALVSRRAAEATANQSTNALRDAAAAAGRAEGLTIPPNMTNPDSMLAKVATGISGKRGTAQAASWENREGLLDLARRAVGLKPDQPVTEAALEGLRREAGKTGYQPIKNLAQPFRADAEYAKDLSTLGNDFSTAAKEFPEIAGNPAIDELRKALLKPEMSPTSAIELVKKLRFDAGKNSKAFDDPAKAYLATAQRGAADAIEGLMERNLATSAPDLVPKFRAARELIAKTYTLEGALENGALNAGKITKEYRGKPWTGEMKTIADVGEHFPKAVENLKEPPTSMSPLDWYAALAASAASGHPGTMAIPPARAAIRNALLSRPGAAVLGTPSYTPNALLNGSAVIANHPLLQRMLPSLVAGGGASYGAQ